MECMLRVRKYFAEYYTAYCFLALDGDIIRNASELAIF